MAEWYYSQYGQTQGPVSEKKLINLVLDDTLESDSYVMNGSDGIWKKIKDIPEIHDKLQAPEPALVHPESTNRQFAAFLESDSRHNIYFYIPIERLVKMTILTMGVYQLYWLYKQWIYWASKHGQAHKSVDREFGWFLFPLMFLDKIALDKELNAVERADFNPRMLFLTWILVGVIASVLYSGFSSISPYAIFMPVIGYSVDVLFLIPVQNYINRVNAKLGNQYEQPSFGHKFCLGLGVISWLILIANLIRSVFYN